MNGKRQNLAMRRISAWIRAVLLGALLVRAAGGVRADATADKRRAMMSGIRRIAIVSPFFSVDRLKQAEVGPASSDSADHRPSDSQSSAKPNSQEASQAARVTTYREQLHKIADHSTHQLMDRIKVRTPFEIVSMDETDRALKALDLTPEKLFGDDARIRNGRFPPPVSDSVRLLAAHLHADAVLLTVLDEPRRINGHYSFNPLSGIDYSSSHVSAHGGFYVVLADGKEALHEFISVVQPLTHIGNRSYLLVDWQEAHNLLIEDMLDDLTRYTPEKK